MTPHYNGTNSRQTGDINLAAALMACAIPLNADDPVRVIDAEHLSKPYASFNVTDQSLDGKHTTEDCMLHWSRVKELSPTHPFAVICTFIQAKPHGRLSADEWLGFAIDYLRDMGIQTPGLGRLSDVELYVSKIPTTPESYILAFVANRATCNELYKAARRAVFMQRDEARTLIDSKLPEWQRKELLSRLQG